MSSTYSVTIAAKDRNDLERQLDLEVEKAIEHGLRDGTAGVRVTRHDFRTFTVEVDPSTAAGTTVEHDAIQRGR